MNKLNEVINIYKLHIKDKIYPISCEINNGKYNYYLPRERINFFELKKYKKINLFYDTEKYVPKDKSIWVYNLINNKKLFQYNITRDKLTQSSDSHDEQYWFKLVMNINQHFFDTIIKSAKSTNYNDNYKLHSNIDLLFFDSKLYEHIITNNASEHLKDEVTLLFNNLIEFEIVNDTHRFFISDIEFIKSIIRNGYNQLLESLLEYDKSYVSKFRATDESSPLHTACAYNNFRAVKALLKHRANVDFTDSCNNKPINLTISQEIRKMLIDHKEKNSLIFKDMDYNEDISINSSDIMGNSDAYIVEDNMSDTSDGFPTPYHDLL